MIGRMIRAFGADDVAPPNHVQNSSIYGCARPHGPYDVSDHLTRVPGRIVYRVNKEASESSPVTILAVSVGLQWGLRMNRNQQSCPPPFSSRRFRRDIASTPPHRPGDKRWRKISRLFSAL